MICRLQTDDERRNIRMKFFKDPVFVISQAILRERKCCLTPEEVFCTAEKFVDFLLKIDISEPELIYSEVDILEDDCKDEELGFQILMTSMMKLSALRKVNPLANSLARILVPRCRKYRDFLDVLGELDRAEQKRIVEKGRVDLLKYELITLSEESNSKGDAMQEINKLVDTILECDSEVIKSAHIAFASHSAQHENKYEKQVQRLLNGYQDKQKQTTDVNKKVIIDYVMKLHPAYISAEWLSRYSTLWNGILDIAEVESSIYNPGKQKGTTFNRNLVGNILHLMIDEKIITANARTCASILEGNGDSSIQAQLRNDPQPKSIKLEVNNLIESYRKKVES